LLLGFPARDEADALCGRMLRRVLADYGVELEMSGTGHLSSELADLVAQRHPDAVLISALGRSREAHLRHILRRLAARDQSTLLVVGLWEGDTRESEFDPQIHASIDAVIVTTLADAVDALRFAALRTSASPRPLAEGRPRVKHTSPAF